MTHEPLVCPTPQYTQSKVLSFTPACISRPPILSRQQHYYISHHVEGFTAHGNFHSQCDHGHLDLSRENECPCRSRSGGRAASRFSRAHGDAGFHEHTETLRLRVLVKTAVRGDRSPVSPRPICDKPFANGRDTRRRGSGQSSRPTVEPVRSTCSSARYASSPSAAFSGCVHSNPDR